MSSFYPFLDCKRQTSLPVAGLYSTNVRVPRLLGLVDHHKTTGVPTDCHPSNGDLIDLLVLPSNTDPYISYRSHPLAIQPDWQPMLGKLVQTLTTVGVLLLQTSTQMCTVLKETRPQPKRQRDAPSLKPAYLPKPVIYQERDSSLPQPLISQRGFVIPILDFLSTCFSKTIFPSGNVSLQPLFGWRCKYLGTHWFDIYTYLLEHLPPAIQS